MTEQKVIASAEAENTGGIYTTRMTAKQHVVIADEPLEVGGNDEGAAPGDFLCMSLASCKVITLRMYAQRKNWKIESIKVTVNLVKGANMDSGNNTFYCTLELTGDLTNEQKTRMLEISRACPIHKLLAKPSDILSELL